MDLIAARRRCKSSYPTREHLLLPEQLYALLIAQLVGLKLLQEVFIKAI
jgi:hypothetical protein